MTHATRLICRAAVSANIADAAASAAPYMFIDDSAIAAHFATIFA